MVSVYIGYNEVGQVYNDSEDVIKEANAAEEDAPNDGKDGEGMVSNISVIL